MNQIDELAKVLWDYHHLHHQLESADILMCFTSLDLSVPVYAAKLLREDYAPKLLISGGGAHNHSIPDKDNIQKTDWGTNSETEKYLEVALENGIPRDKITLETKSTNSGENVLFSYKILKETDRIPKSVIIVHKPTMERRTYATFMNFWPESDVKVMVTSEPISYEDYIEKVVEREVIINIMVGDLQRIKLYPGKGFQIYQEIPDDVWSAYQELVKLGYTKHLIE